MRENNITFWQWWFWCDVTPKIYETKRNWAKNPFSFPYAQHQKSSFFLYSTRPNRKTYTFFFLLARLIECSNNYTTIDHWYSQYLCIYTNEHYTHTFVRWAKSVVLKTYGIKTTITTTIILCGCVSVFPCARLRFKTCVYHTVFSFVYSFEARSLFLLVFFWRITSYDGIDVCRHVAIIDVNKWKKFTFALMLAWKLVENWYFLIILKVIGDKASRIIKTWLRCVIEILEQGFFFGYGFRYWYCQRLFSPHCHENGSHDGLKQHLPNFACLANTEGTKILNFYCSAIHFWREALLCRISKWTSRARTDVRFEMCFG